jgi:hypothetical protein
MNIEIWYRPENDQYVWSLVVGVVYEGVEHSLGEVFERIIYYRTINALNYTETTHDEN